jgi:hypothetical protein
MAERPKTDAATNSFRIFTEFSPCLKMNIPRPASNASGVLADVVENDLSLVLCIASHFAAAALFLGSRDGARHRERPGRP